MNMKDSKNQITIEWCPDKQKQETLREQIFDFFKDNIISRNWAPRQRIPSQRELATQFNVNRSTVDEAMSELISEGLLKTKVGSGTFVAGNSPLLVIPSWGEHVSSGLFHQNLNCAQMDNHLSLDEKYINLASNEPPENLLSKIPMGKAMKEVAPKISSLNDSDPLGLPQLRNTLAARLHNLKIKAGPENILITTGLLQALYLISVSLMGKNMSVICESPSYLNLLQVFQSIGANLVNIPMDNMGMDLCCIRQKIKNEKGKHILYTIPNYQTPTGMEMSEERRHALFAYCKKNQLLIIENDAYGELWLDQKPPDPIKSQDSSGMILYTGTVSQTFSSGLKIGWIVGPQSVIKRLSDVKMQTDHGSSVLSQLLVQELFASGYYDKHVEKIRIELKKKRGVMMRLLAEYFSEIAKWDTPKGGFQVWLKLNKRINQNQLFHTALKEGIWLNPDSAYSCTSPNCLRLSYSNVTTADMRYAVKKLKEIITDLYCQSAK